MKNFVTIFIILLFTACTQHVYLKVLQPASVTIPPHIKRIGVINRSFAAKEDKWLNILEGILTGESIGADREGAEQALMAVKTELECSGRFIVSLPAVSLNGNTATFDQPLDYSVVHAICQRHNLDGIVSMENFDSNSKLNFSTVDDFVKLPNGTKQKVVKSLANVDLQVITRWRMYDDSTKNIVDNYAVNNTKHFSAKGDNPNHAQSKLPFKRNAINQTGYANGIIYGQRISPYWTSIERFYFRKGTDNLKLAASYAKKNQWQKAIEIWKKEMSVNPDKKTAGRACYNMAVACEREGNLSLAMEYARRASNEYKVKEAFEYIRAIKRRMNDKELLNYQMDNK